MKTRRDFLSLIGKASIGSFIVPPFLINIGNANNTVSLADFTDADKAKLRKIMLKGMAPTDADDLVLADGMKYDVLIRWNTPINNDDCFGFNNDFTCYIPLSKSDPDEGLLWVNHEYTSPMWVSGYNRRKPDAKRNKAQVTKEMKSVGGSIIHIKKEGEKWSFVAGSKYNRRLDGHTPIPFNWDHKIEGKDQAIGTLANCSGGITPWGTILTCEENYDVCFGECEYTPAGARSVKNSILGWEKYYDYPPEHYGWVVEVDPRTGKAQKHIALGRCAHECCTLVELPDGRIVAYTGDDANDEFIYKFISSKPGSLKEGTLYVADTKNGKWLPLVYDKNEKFKRVFKNQTDLLVQVRKAARMIGGTPQNRPEDIEIDPLNGNIIVSLTNNKPKGDFHGSLLKIVEKDGKHDALTFEAESMLVGGEENGFSCPDNLAFDLAGNLWFTSDISGSSMNNPKKPYMAFKNNGLFVMIRHGEEAGQVIQVASAPTDAELTGPWFSPDYKTLFLSVQHPGERTKTTRKPTSTWPHDGDNKPKPSVVTVQGPLLDKLNNLHRL